MAMQFQKATKKNSRLRLALVGPSGSGKTFTALRVGCRLGAKVAVIDSERGSASKYADRFQFDVLELDSFAPQTYVAALHAAEAAGYDVVIIDSLSHAWTGKDGLLEQVDKVTARSRSKNAFSEGWREASPIHNEMIDSIIRCRAHVIATMRSKTEWVMEEDDRGKKAPRKIGLAPVQRDGMEFEFDVVGDMDEAKLVVSKSRCPDINKAVVKEPGEDFADTLKKWLTDGIEAPEPMREPRPEPPAPHGNGRAPLTPEQQARETSKAHALRLYNLFLARGAPKADWPPFVMHVLGSAKPSDTWTQEDIDAVEGALPAAQQGAHP